MLSLPKAQVLRMHTILQIWQIKSESIYEDYSYEISACMKGTTLTILQVLTSINYWKAWFLTLCSSIHTRNKQQSLLKKSCRASHAPLGTYCIVQCCPAGCIHDHMYHTPFLIVSTEHSWVLHIDYSLVLSRSLCRNTQPCYHHHLLSIYHHSGMGWVYRDLLSVLVVDKKA